MKREQNVWAQASRYLGLAFVMPISTLVGYVIGWGLDKLFRTHFLYLVFLALGGVSGFIELFRELAADARRDGN
jgi:F0F1-type ATP synthase assembly protein I